MDAISLLTHVQNLVSPVFWVSAINVTMVTRLMSLGTVYQFAEMPLRPFQNNVTMDRMIKAMMDAFIVPSIAIQNVNFAAMASANNVPKGIFCPHSFSASVSVGIRI